MKYLLAVLLMAGSIFGQTQIVPQQVLTAKTAISKVYWPQGNPADAREVKYEADNFLKKWKRFEVTQDVDKADIAVVVMVEPMTVYPGFWQRVAWGVAASQAGTHCSGQAYGSTVQTNCYTRPAPAPLMPNTVLTGSILIFDGNDLRKWRADTANLQMPQPIMVSFAEGNGNKPLLAAGKKLRKMIDAAAH
jgi:hypothetical protein